MKVNEAARTAATAPQKSPADSPTPHHSVYCPNCSNRLVEHKCKLICQLCGYFLSCADYY